MMRYGMLCGALTFILTLFSAAVCHGQDIVYTAGQDRTDEISGSANLGIAYPSPLSATQSGDISGGTGDVLTISGNQNGTLFLRGDNTGFDGTVVFESGILNINDSSQLFGRMAGFTFDGHILASYKPTLQVDSGADIVIDGGSTGNQRLSLAGRAGTIQLLNDAGLTWQNSKSESGGAIHVADGSEFVLTAETGARYRFVGNSASNDGGAVYVSGSTLAVQQADFENNSATNRSGGALYAQSAGTMGATVTLSDVSFTGNHAGYDGGAVTVAGSSLTTQSRLMGNRLQFTNNTSDRSGGALRNTLSAVTLMNSALTGNRALNHGGAIANDNIVELSDSIVSGNTAGQDGGAMYSYYNDNATTVRVDATRTDFIGNTATNGRGGAIYYKATSLNLINTNFTDNRSGRDGGAIFQQNGTTNLSVTTGVTSTFSGNSDRSGSSGIFMSAQGNTAELNIDVATSGTLDMQNALSGEAGSSGRAGSIIIEKTSLGAWNLGGNGVFTSAAGGTTTVNINAGTLHLYGLNEGGRSTGSGGLTLAGAGSTINFASNTILRIGGDNTLSAEGGLVFRQRATIYGGNGPNNSTKLNFSPAVLEGEAVINVANANQTLVLNGRFTGGTGLIQKSGTGQILLTQTGSSIEELNVARGGIGFVVGDDDAAVNLYANKVYIHPGTVVSVSGFNGTQQGQSVTLIQSVDDIYGDVSSYEVGGVTGGVDYLSAQVTKTADQKRVVADVALTWYAQPADAHGTFTLATDRSAFRVGTVLEDRTGVFPTNNWDGRSLTKDGLGTLTLTAANTYTGDTRILNGILAIDDLGGTGVNSADKTVYVDAPGSLFLNINAAASGTYAKTLSGDGTLVKHGDGRVAMTADNSAFSGNVSVDGGTLAALRENALGTGAVALVDTLELGYDGDFRNTVTGAGQILTTRDIVLTGDHTGHTGTTRVTGGTTRLGAGFASTALFDVGPDATLAGDGDIRSLLVRSGGTLAPGDNFEQLRVADDATFESGSTYLVILDDDDDISNNLWAGGSVTIESGASLSLRPGGISPTTGQRRYELITTGTGLTDDTLFDMGPASRVGYDLRQEIAGNSLYLAADFKTPDLRNLVSGVGTPNAIRAGDALDGLIAFGAAADLGGLYDSLLNLSADPAVVANALGQLHGEVFASGQAASARLQQSFTRQSRSARDWNARARSCVPTLAESLYTVWASFTSSWLDRNEIGRYSGYDVKATA
ncbi:MAG: autotransporter-associated beta strand repeat-containing protein [Planctomycetaceae bacterium]|nr:autotransporter-associated beta strand repeat-containing protein [Planctomycetaceae bacterium]